jgi:hypothetical protein
MSRIDELKNTPRVFHMQQNYPIDLRSQYGDNYSHGLVDLLNTIKLNKNTSVIVEVGGYAGVTTEIFALSVNKVFVQSSWNVDQIFSHRGDVDIAKSMFDEVVSNYPDTITVLDPTIVDEGYELTNQSVDLLYLDRVFYPNEVEAVLKKWLPKVKDGGYVGVHTYYMDGQIPKTQLDNLINIVGSLVNLDYSVYGDGTILVRKAGEYNALPAKYLRGFEKQAAEHLENLAKQTPTPTVTPTLAPTPTMTPTPESTATPKLVETKKIEFMKEIKPTE